MKILIAEDEYVSRKFLYKFLSDYGECDVTVDGMEAIEAFLMALDEGKPYNLICLDIMMPEVDGLKALKTIRQLEKERNIPKENRARIIMTTALNYTKEINAAFEAGSEAYAAKPINTEKLVAVMKKLKLIN
ncbi:MAG: response regulator [Tissierellales bacterium]|jgi:two-component system chemotaxis response regulator CheY|nr:response regulator [Tissierellales bacterium]